VGFVRDRGVKGDRAIDTVKTSVAAIVVLVELGFFDHVATGYLLVKQSRLEREV